ncbi:MAG TPA: manganese-binding protein [Zetaproteobacteria bacterium]|nr:manganese-binding protein [Zetaproteobacteria bacterium]
MNPTRAQRLLSVSCFRLAGGIPGLILCLLACMPAASAGGIVTTLPPLTGLVLLLDADVDVHCLLPPGADAHDFQITPRQAQLLKGADLLIRSSYDDRHWSGLRSNKQVFDLWPDQGHAWLSPRAVRDRLPALAATLQKLSPQRSEQIAAALEHALTSSKVVEAAWIMALAPLYESGVIMQHNAWQTTLREFGVPVWGVLETGHHGDDIGPRQLENALELMRKHPGAVLWGNQRHPDRALYWLREHRGEAEVKLLRFDPLGDCGMTWPQLMQRNLDLLAGHASQ